MLCSQHTSYTVKITMEMFIDRIELYSRRNKALILLFALGDRYCCVRGVDFKC